MAPAGRTAPPAAAADSTAAPGTRSFAERAYLQLRDQLVMLEIRPGAPINDERVADQLGMGRTPVREALKRLETERLVIAHPRRGTFATDVNITDLRHIFEVREQLEPFAAATAASRKTADDQRRLGDLLAQVRRPSARRATAVQLMRTDLQVHRAIYAATHNPYLEDTLVHYDNLATRIWCLFTDQLTDLAGHVGEHAPLMTAILDGNATAASTLARQHVARFERAIRAVI